MTAPGGITLDDRGVGAWIFEGPADAPVVLAVHDFTANGLWFGDLADAVAPDWRLASLDLRGRAGSRGAAPPASIADHVADVVCLADRVGAPRCTLVGHGTGAAVALECAATHPDRIDAVVALDGPPLGVHEPMLDWVHEAARVDPGVTRLGATYPERATVIAADLATGRLPATGLTRSLRRAVDAEVAGSGFGLQPRLSAATLETDWSLLQGWCPAAPPRAPLRCLRAGHGHRRDEPALALWDLGIEPTVHDSTHSGILVDPTAIASVAQSLAAVVGSRPIERGSSRRPDRPNLA